MPRYAMDGLLTTMHLNYGPNDNPLSFEYGSGVGTGFLMIPSISNATIACGLLFETADDRGSGAPFSDPITVTLEGSNASSIEVLHLGSSWTLIYNGSTGIKRPKDRGIGAYGIQQSFSNTKRFAGYRLLITSVRARKAAVQYSEARIMGYM